VNVNCLLEDVNCLHEDVNCLHEDVNCLHEDVNCLPEDVNCSLPEDVNCLPEDVSGRADKVSPVSHHDAVVRQYVLQFVEHFDRVQMTISLLVTHLTISKNEIERMFINLNAPAYCIDHHKCNCSLSHIHAELRDMHESIYLLYFSYIYPLYLSYLYLLYLSYLYLIGKIQIDKY